MQKLRKVIATREGWLGQGEMGVIRDRGVTGSVWSDFGYFWDRIKKFGTVQSGMLIFGLVPFGFGF